MEEGKTNTMWEIQCSLKYFPVKQPKIEPFLCWVEEFRIYISP